MGLALAVIAFSTIRFTRAALALLIIGPMSLVWSEAGPHPDVREAFPPLLPHPISDASRRLRPSHT
jgi:hypothetical protein